MSERKVLQKYYPPDFDPSAIERRRGGRKEAKSKTQPVRLMAPFSMKCIPCGEYIYKGRKFNAQKETTDETYVNSYPIHRFYIRCTRCSAEITFKTDPKYMDYVAERNAVRNFEPWRAAKLAEETEEERLDRLEREEEEKDAMKDLEKKTLDAKTEMDIADALDDVRHRNAARSRYSEAGIPEIVVGPSEEDRNWEEEAAEQAKAAFCDSEGNRVKRLSEEEKQKLKENVIKPQNDNWKIAKKKSKKNELRQQIFGKLKAKSVAEVGKSLV